MTALAVLVAFAPPALAKEPDAGVPPEALERVCGWVDGPEAVVLPVLEGEDSLTEECRAMLRCFPEARGTPAATAAAAKAVCKEVLSLSPDDLRGLVEVLEAGEPAEPCVGFLRCLLPWRDEFARICGRTEDATSLPRREIEELLRDSGALLERIEGLGIPEAKVYAFRLEKCRAFFEYALELQELRDGEDAASDG